MVVCTWIYRDISGHVLSKYLYVYHVSYKKTTLGNLTNGKPKRRSG